ETVLPRLPREIVRIERNTVTANPRAWIKGHEAERLRRRRATHFPRIDVERVTESRHLVRHADVDRSKRVFEKLRRFGHTRRADRMYVIDDLRIEMRRNGGRVIRHATDDLGNVVRLKLRIARIDALWRKRE